MSVIDPGQHSCANPTNNVSGWVDLPTELLMKIFTHLKLVELEIKEYHGNRKSLLSTRLVHPRWKLVMDELLEKWCLEFWTKWKPTYPSNVPDRYNFPLLSINQTSKNIGIKDILSPACLSRPPPTKSVCITERHKLKVWKGHNFLLKLGSNLTSLTFSYISGTVLPKTIAIVLTSTPNVKAIAIQNVDITRGVEKIVLPTLRNLEYVKLSIVDEEFMEWILKPYAKQLVTVETDNYFMWNSEEDSLAYENLKGLKISPSPYILPETPIALHSLQFLSLGGLKVAAFGPANFQIIQKFISHYCTTLVDLHLDINHYIPSYPRVYAKIVRKNNDDEDEAVFVPPFNDFIFPLLKTFWIFFPRTGGEVGIVKDFLKMFPALETLILLHDFGELDRETARNCMVEEKFWRVCPKLKNIRVQVGGCADKVIFKMQAPF